MKNSFLHFFAIIFSIFFLLGFIFSTSSSAFGREQLHLEPNLPLSDFDYSNRSIYIPLVLTPSYPVFRVNVPYINGDIPAIETAIFWFGQVTPTDNYADVRLGYNDRELYVNVSQFDRRLWYDTSPSPADLTEWDAVSLYLDLDGNIGENPDTNSYKFVAQLNWSEARADWQISSRGDGSDWGVDQVPFTTVSEWRGNALRDDIDDHGWRLIFRIPFTALGLSGPPSQGTIWGVAASLHDRDDASATLITKTYWPENMDSSHPRTWGKLSFGLPIYTPPPARIGGLVTIRHGLDGINVTDGHVGGHTVCGEGHYFDDWGELNYAGYEQFNIQNQWDISDWRCFSKYYVTFPLYTIPSGKEILSATLQIYEFGGSNPNNAQPSLIQVLTVDKDWDEATLTWNNAPLPRENVSQAWVDPITDWPGWPGVPRNWDVSRAVAEAYTSGEPLRLVLYSADGAYDSGKYFISSDTGDWNEEGRPTLNVLWGEP